MDLIAGLVPARDHQFARYLHEADAARGERARVELQVLDAVERDREAALGELGEIDLLGRAERAKDGLREFEHERGRKRAVGIEIAENFGKKTAARQGLGRDV